MTPQEFISYLIPKVKLYVPEILPSLVIAQACKESAFGVKAFHNNILGIKCHSGVSCSTGKTGEIIGNNLVPLRLPFAVYDSIDDCLKDYNTIMHYINPYGFDRYKPVRESKCYQEATYWVRQQGYATSLTYVTSLRSDYIKPFKLYNLDYKKEYESDLTNNFKWYEAFSSLRLNNYTYIRAIEPEEKYWDNIMRVALQVQKIREKLGKPLPVNSWWRTEEYNNTLQNASKTSYHLRGLAIDLPTPKGMSATQFRDFIKNKCNTEFTYFIVYSWGVHCDMR